MFEKYSRQALPEKEYRELLGSALCAFNSNNAFIIENILRMEVSNETWYDLTDKTSGQLNEASEKLGSEIFQAFKELVAMRNRIVHSFQITDQDGKQKLCTKIKGNDKSQPNQQFIIDEKYLLDFIEKNERLCFKLYEMRG